MTRPMFPAAFLLLAACGGGDDRTEPEDSAKIGPEQKAERAAPAETPDIRVDADLPRAGPETPAKPEGESSAGTGGAIPPAIRGRWALKAADCPKKPGTDLTALVIDAANLRFHESHGELARVRERSANRIAADYKFSGEGIEWDRQMVLSVEDGGKTLVRRDHGEGAASTAMRYTRCS